MLTCLSYRQLHQCFVQVQHIHKIVGWPKSVVLRYVLSDFQTDLWNRPIIYVGDLIGTLQLHFAGEMSKCQVLRFISFSCISTFSVEEHIILMFSHDHNYAIWDNLMP